jgi:hypothetical protein
MNETTKNAALVSLDEWNAIHDSLRKAFTYPDPTPLSADAFLAAAQNIQSQPAD